MSGFYKRKIVRSALLIFFVGVLLGFGWWGIALYAVEKTTAPKKAHRSADQ